MFDYTWIITIAAITGAAANACKKRWGFGVWIVTNGFWAIYNLGLGLYSQALLFLVFFLTSIVGFIRWSKPNEVVPIKTGDVRNDT